MKTLSVLLVSLTILSLFFNAALACGPGERMLPFRSTQQGGDDETSRTGKLPTLHEATEGDALQMPVRLPLWETGEIIIQILRTALV
jgi:hypothetical protein